MEWRDLEFVLKKHPEVIEGAKQSANRLRFVGLLADYFPTEQRNVRLLKLALDIDILYELEANPIDLSLVRRLSRRLTDDFFLQQDRADWVVDMWLHAYGVGVLGKALPRMEEEKRLLEEKRRQEEEKRQLEEKRRQEEEKRRQEEKRHLLEEGRRQEEEKRWQLAEKRRPLNANVMISFGKGSLYLTKWEGNSKVTTTKHDIPFCKTDKHGKGTDIIAMAEGGDPLGGRYGSIGLKSDGTVVINWQSSMYETNDIFSPRSNSTAYNNVMNWKDIIAVAAGYHHVVGLKMNGTVVAEGDNKYGECNVSYWKNIIAIAASNFFTIGLKSDGTVIATGSTNPFGGVSYWKNIIAIAVSANHIIGLKSDGTVVAEGAEKLINDQYTKPKCVDAADWNWKGIIAIATTKYYSIGLQSDGTVVRETHTISCGRDYSDVSYWKDIIAIAANSRYAVGLRSDGRILSTTKECVEEIAKEIEEQRKCGKIEKERHRHCQQLAEKRQLLEKTAHLIDAAISYTVGVKSNGTVYITGRFQHHNIKTKISISKWKNIVAVAAGDYHTVGLKSDGTVVAEGYNSRGQCDVADWENIIAVAVGGYNSCYAHTVGLKSDGTVVATGDNKFGQCDVSNWKNIIAIAAGWYHTVGLKSDGTVIAVGKYFYNETHYSGDKMFDWRSIVAIAAGDLDTVGLKADGTVLYSDGSVLRGEDIVAIAMGNSRFVGLKLDGTVVGLLYDHDESDWKDIVAIATNSWHTVGLKSDGTVVAAGAPFTRKRGERGDVSDWKDILAR